MTLNLDSLKGLLQNVHTEDVLPFVMPAVGGVAGGIGGNLLAKKKSTLARTLATLVGALGGSAGGAVAQNYAGDLLTKAKLKRLGEVLGSRYLNPDENNQGE